MKTTISLKNTTIYNAFKVCNVVHTKVTDKREEISKWFNGVHFHEYSNPR